MPVSRTFSLTAAGISVNLHDKIAVMRTINQAVVDVFAECGQKNYKQPGIFQFIIVAAACIVTFVFVGLPKLLNMEFSDKRYLITIGVVLFWTLKWINKYLTFKESEVILLLRGAENKRSMVISAKIDLKTGDYVIYTKDETLLRKSIGAYFNEDGEIMESTLIEDVTPICDKVQGMLQEHSKTD